MIKGSITGVSTSTVMQKVWRVSQGVGDIAFAFPYSMIILEIQVKLGLPLHLHFNFGVKEKLT